MNMKTFCKQPFQIQENNDLLFKFPLAPMGVLAPGSENARASPSPSSAPAEILRRMCLQSHLQTLKNIENNLKTLENT